VNTNTIIIHRDSTDPFARVPKDVLNSKEISWKAKGILAYLLGKPQDWRAQVQDIVNHGTDGEAAVRSALKELRDSGYARLDSIRDKGKVVEWILKVSDMPVFINEEPDGENPHVDNSHLNKPDLNNRPITKKELTKTESTNTHAPKSGVRAYEFQGTDRAKELVNALKQFPFYSVTKPESKRRELIAAEQMLASGETIEGIVKVARLSQEDNFAGSRAHGSKLILIQEHLPEIKARLNGALHGKNQKDGEYNPRNDGTCGEPGYYAAFFAREDREKAERERLVGQVDQAQDETQQVPATA
jgi:hypothetical protein